MIAHVLDVMIVFAIIIIVSLASYQLLGLIDTGLGAGIAAIASTMSGFLYFILMEGLWHGQTLGKKAAGVRVRMADGTPITFMAALSRNLLRPADMIPFPYFLGVLAMFLNPKAQRIGDLVAGTIVCYERREQVRYAVAPHSVGIHPLEAHVGELRGMTMEEYTALRRLCDRFPELPQRIQHKLMEEVWQPVAERRKVPVLAEVHPIYLAEAVVMKYGRQHGLL